MAIGLRAKRLAWSFACALGAHSIWRRLNARRLLIVNYHGVRSDDSARRAWLLLPQREFAAQLAYLHRHYRVLPIDEALRQLWNGTLDRPTACITFDDGYRNNLTIAAPVLRSLGLPATIYLATGLIGTRRHLWTIEVELAFEQTRLPAANLAVVGLGQVSLATAGDRSSVCALAKREMKTLGDRDRDDALETLKQALDVQAFVDDADYSLMSWDEVQHMGSDGSITFGGHTVNHVILSRSASDVVESEVRGSVDRVRELKGAVSETFAYPNGRRMDFDGRAQDALRALGVTGAVTTIEGLNDSSTDRFALRRVAVGDDMTLADFKLRTSGFLPAVRRVFGRAADA